MPYFFAMLVNIQQQQESMDGLKNDIIDIEEAEEELRVQLEKRGTDLVSLQLDPGTLYCVQISLTD